MAIKRKMSDGWEFVDDKMYGAYNVYQDTELFKINPNWQSIAQVHDIGKRNTPIVIIDDFLVNVDRVRELALSAHYSNDDSKMHASPGIRCVFKLNWQINKVAKTYFNNWYSETLDVDYAYPNFHNLFTIIDTSEPMANIQCWPHIDVDWPLGQEIGTKDTQHVATLVYLNTPEECKGGTAIYKHKKRDSHLCISKEEYEEWNQYKNPKRDTNINEEKNDFFELAHLAEMKYNRLVMYPTCMYHHPVYSPNDFTGDNCRITLGSFV